ncbi:MAG: undecaprenyl-diphosphate phosphatase [Candidatus Pacebacteria bacterium]|nr:undecaprenyl-diphosphate phosphatase [Candidatus Paceibacterota bacterium]MDD2756999.1 undecaprenyl-diphosphate phosphatase [Candidatus Paceibacterota bacterium]MDD3283509.1 undecaprenyl-diphosphate phosphatase [Candidatus Paceibacterota bacterium]MDD3969635.1 undecaprenyl-diphosphate phosphatase [Candidatus Paceibacterota bacterium]MDD4738025.1 undecaprenyl-diphosphate phosphatase [Candidatus Paceibacterota bacterium]
MWEYFLLGALQGIFEWLPISSQGVMTIFSSFVDIEMSAIDFSLFLHSGTMLAVLIFFRKDWINLILLKDKELLRFFVIASIVSLSLGFVLYKTIGDIALGSGLLFLIGFGLLLTSWFQKKNIRLNISKDFNSIIVGLLQGLSVIPGVSRSGSTIFGLSLKENDPSEILKRSYIISLPAVAASTGYIFLNNPTISSFPWITLLSSFIFGIISLKLLLGFSKKVNFSKLTMIFGILCIIGGIIEWLI